jgi:hypothetical protein
MLLAARKGEEDVEQTGRQRRRSRRRRAEEVRHRAADQTEAVRWREDRRAFQVQEPRACTVSFRKNVLPRIRRAARQVPFLVIDRAYRPPLPETRDAPAYKFHTSMLHIPEIRNRTEQALLFFDAISAIERHAVSDSWFARQSDFFRGVASPEDVELLRGFTMRGNKVLNDFLTGGAFMWSEWTHARNWRFTHDSDMLRPWNRRLFQSAIERVRFSDAFYDLGGPDACDVFADEPCPDSPEWGSEKPEDWDFSLRLFAENPANWSEALRSYAMNTILRDFQQLFQKAPRTDASVTLYRGRYTRLGTDPSLELCRVLSYTFDPTIAFGFAKASFGKEDDADRVMVVHVVEFPPGTPMICLDGVSVMQSVENQGEVIVPPIYSLSLTRTATMEVRGMTASGDAQTTRVLCRFFQAVLFKDGLQ